MANTNLHPKTALITLTALNLVNYVDRSVLNAVQTLVQGEFRVTKAEIGFLSTAFLIFYMIAAPFVGPLADRYSRKVIIALGAFFWSGLTLLTAVTHTYTELLIRHTLVGVGEATFVTIAPTFVADLFSEDKRGRIFGVFYLSIPVGFAAGYLLGDTSVRCMDGAFRSTSQPCRDSCWASRSCSSKSRNEDALTRWQRLPSAERCWV